MAPLIESDLDKYIDTMAGGPVWSRVKARERKYWNTVLNNSSRRVDNDDKVGGLLDITEVVPSIRQHVTHQNYAGAHVVGRVSRRYTRPISYPTPLDLPSVTEELLSDHENMVIAGGYPLSFLTRLASNDVDIFLPAPGLDEEELSNMVRTQVLSAASEHGYHAHTEHAVSSSFQVDIHRELYDYYLPDSFQVILRKYHSVTEVLMGFDIGACGVGIYKGKLYATERALYEIMNGVIMVTINPDDGTLDRASTTYLRRLNKYLVRGFNIHVEGVQRVEHPPRSFYLQEENIVTMSSLAYLIGMYRYYIGNGLVSRDIRTNLRRARQESPHINVNAHGSDYGSADMVKGPNWLIHGQGRGRGYYTSRIDGVSYRTQVEEPVLLRELTFITVRAYRQGSLSHDPVTISLRSWAGDIATYGPPIKEGMNAVDGEDNMDKKYQAALININAMLSKIDGSADVHSLISGVRDYVDKVLDNQSLPYQAEEDGLPLQQHSEEEYHTDEELMSSMEALMKN